MTTDLFLPDENEIVFIDNLYLEKKPEKETPLIFTRVMPSLEVLPDINEEDLKKLPVWKRDAFKQKL